ncbi:MAG: hypothetical protein F4241_00380 [Rhodothermaceae bacterium]|nr:hypothetical protein [Rhodothermaceae bacterium]
MAPSHPSLSVDPTSARQHENPAAAELEQKISDREAFRRTNVFFPISLHAQLQRHVSKSHTNLRELVGTALEKWVTDHAGDLEKIQKGEVDIPAVEDGRKARGKQGKTQNIVVFLPREIHMTLKKVTVLRNLTMRGIIIGVMQEWVQENCE